jgi:uncharacterized membrane protein
LLQEPLLAGVPLTLVFLYFVWYSLLGWAMETTYCSIKEGHFVARGFLHGPVCPIYGVGALLMVLVLNRFTGNVPVFLVVSTVTMSAWEYLVGWLLETTTHIKYWDYSNQRFNLKGRICLKNSLYWGLVSYVAIYWIHPQTVQLFSRLQLLGRWIASGVLAAIMLGDTVTTIRSLALTTKFLEKAEAAHRELEEAQAKVLQSGQQKLEEAAVRASLMMLELKEANMLAEAAHHSQRFVRHYGHLSSAHYHKSIQTIRRTGSVLRAHRKRMMAKLRTEQTAAKAKRKAAKETQ